MPYCARCGVEVDAGTEACPLCEAPVPVFDDDASPPSGRYPAADTALEPLSPRQVRMAAWAVLSAVLLLASLAVMVIDLVQSGFRLTWSGYVLGSIGLAWTLATSAILFFRRPWLVVLAGFAPLLGYLALVDLVDGGLDWLLGLGLPVATAFALALEASAILWTVWKDRGSNQVAILLLLLSGVGVVVDLAVAARLGRPSPTWSLAVLAVVAPLSGLLFVQHYVLRKMPRLRRYFHV